MAEDGKKKAVEKEKGVIVRKSEEMLVAEEKWQDIRVCVSCVGNLSCAAGMGWKGGNGWRCRGLQRRRGARWVEAGE